MTARRAVICSYLSAPASSANTTATSASGSAVLSSPGRGPSDGRSIVLERRPGTDTEGYAGLEDGVDHHWGQLLMAAAISTLLGGGTELVAGGEADESRVLAALRRGAQDTIATPASRSSAFSSTFSRRLLSAPAFPVRVLLTRDIVVEPYRG